MRDPNEPLEPETSTMTPSVTINGAGIEVVSPEELLAGVDRHHELVRCDEVTAARSLAALPRAQVVVITPDSISNTGCAARLARLLAEAAKVVVIDMADTSTTSREMLGDANAPGLLDVLAQAQKLSKCLRRDEESEAMVLPFGRSEHALQGTEGPLLAVVMEALAKAYRFVIVDAGGADPGAVSRIADKRCGIVLAAGPGAESEIEHRVAQLRSAGFDEPVVVHPT